MLFCAEKEAGEKRQNNNFSMARKAASLKSTSGAGFPFEDQVAAYFLANLLAGGFPLGDRFGRVIRLDFQTRAIGWYLDDLLVTGQYGRIALSIKSNVQITRTGLPADFIRDAWEQYLRDGSQAFDVARDYLGLVTVPPSPRVSEDLQELARWAESEDDDRFLTQVRTGHASSDSKRQLFASLHCPPELAATHGVIDRDAVRLLRRLRFLSFQFQGAQPRDALDSIRLCQQTLRSKNRDEAVDLWRELERISQECRQSGGYLDLARILAKLQRRFRLEQWPDIASDVAALRQWSAAGLATVPDRIGMRVHVDRPETTSELAEMMAISPFAALTGPSGCGKSALVKGWVAGLPDDVPVLWLDAAALEGRSAHELQGTLRLQHSLNELTAALTSPTAYCILDGAGSITADRAYANLVSLLRALNVGEEEGSCWHFLLVCQQEEWNRLQTGIARACGRIIPWGKVSIEGFRAEEAAPVWTAFPQLARLAVRPELHSLLLRPKVLDLIAARVALGESVSTTGWVGESSVARWYWESEVAKPPAALSRARTAMIVAEQQADTLSPAVSTAGLPDNVDVLVGDRVLKALRDGTAVSFQHDLLADWARLHVLLEQGENLQAFLEAKLASPYWNRAVRLYGVYLLEQYDGPEQWKLALDAVIATGNAGGQARDLLLEAVFFAANPLPLLEAVWPLLTADDGQLLRRLLGRFLYAATEPNPRYLALASTPAEALRWATEERLPYWPLWIPMLRFLNRHRDDAVALAPVACAKVADSWLRHTAVGFPLRDEAAQIALVAAEADIANEYVHTTDGSEGLAFRAGLAAINELPDQVRQFALRASGRKRRTIETEPGDVVATRLSRRQTVPPYRQWIRGRTSGWPDGPEEEAMARFKDLCFTSDGLFPIIDADPALAGELLLALLIEPPREYEDEHGGGFRSIHDEEYCGLKDREGGHYPPSYWHFPWLYFIRQHPGQAIATILKLVNHATERYADNLGREYGVVPQLKFKMGRKERAWIGDANAYLWHVGTYGPHVTASVLMALEFWLYERLDAGADVSAHLDFIIREARSIAFVGLLACVASKYPRLLKGQLRFVMSVPEVLRLEKQAPMVRTGSTALMAWGSRGEAAMARAVEWYGMPHRQMGLHLTAFHLFMTDRQTRSYFRQVTKRWERLRQDALRNGDVESAEEFEITISAFTPGNQIVQYDEDQQRVLLGHRLPEDLEARTKPKREEAEAGLLRTTFPLRCRRLLEGEEQLVSEAALERFWAECQAIATGQDGDREWATLREDATCGGAAVLLLRHREWLEGYPERRAWCVDHLLATVESPPTGPLHDSEITKTRWHWHSFCAEALPELWQDDLASRRLRHCIALLALDKHYETVGILFHACHIRRSRLGSQFSKLQALLRHWATERPELRRRENQANGGIVLREEQRRSFRTLEGENGGNLLSEKFRAIAASFVVDTLSPDIPPLTPPTSPVSSPTARAASSAKPRVRPEKRRRLDYAVDFNLLLAAYGYLPPLDMATDGRERAQWLGVWCELLECLLQTVRPDSDDEEKEVAGTPYEAEVSLLNCIALVIVQMSPEERPEGLWRPILDLGWTARHWVDFFLTGFFSLNLPKTSKPEIFERFVRIWSEMVDFAETSPKWNRLSGPGWWDVEDNWESLMGLDRSSGWSWSANLQPVLLAFKARLRAFCETRVRRADTMARVLRLLHEPAATAIRVEALQWIEPLLAAPQNAAQMWGHRSEVEAMLSQLLAECWEVNQEELRRSRPSFLCFRSLVSQLADRQNLIALEIQSRIIAG